MTSTATFLRALVSIAGSALSIALASPSAPPAAEPSGFTDPVFRHVTPEQGLPNSVVTSLAQDAQGFLWIGSIDGLARWDGYRTKVIGQSKPRQGIPGSNAFLTLHCDPQGRLWAGTMFGGLLKYDPAEERLKPWEGAGGDALSGRSVYALSDDGAEGLWIATNGGLDHLDNRSGRVVHASAPNQWAAAAGTGIQALLTDREGRFWLSTSRGLFMRPTPSSALESVPLAPEGNVVPRSLAQDRAGRIWAGTQHQGVFVLTAQRGLVTSARVATPTLPEGAKALDGAAILDMAEVRPDEMWLATRDQGIVAVSLDRGWSRRIRHVPDSASSLLDNTTRALLRDRSGLIWVATTMGVSHHDPQRTAITQRIGSGPDEVRLYAPRASTEVSWILALPGSGHWLGTHKAGIERLDAQGRHAGWLLLDPQRPAGEPQDMVLGMTRAGDGSVYVATQRGLFRASPDGRRAQRMSIAGRDPRAQTYAVLAEGDDLWIGGGADGLWHLDLKTGRSGPAPLQSPGLSDPQVTLIAGSRREGLWVGTRNGLNRVDMASGRAARVLAQRIANTFISSLVTDRQGRTWVGVYGDGIHVLPADGNEAAVMRLGMEQGLPAASVDAMLLDVEGAAMWVSMDGTLARIDTASLAVQPFGRKDGPMLPTYWTGSAAPGLQGELLFGGAGGVTVVHPARFGRSAYRPQVLVSDIQVGGQTMPALAGTASLQVPADSNSLAVEVASSALGFPERNRYAFKLEGLDADWRESDASRRLATYANLPPGDYTLHLKASNGDGIWGEAQKALPVRVQAAWHQRWWFRGLLAAALLAAFAGAVSLRTRLLQARQRVLERHVQERTAALKAAHLALEEKSRQLELSSVTDPLTGLHNRRYVADHIGRDLAAARRRATDARAAGGALTDTTTAFLLVDLDRFKQVNDGHGHAAGDAVLVELGVRLKAVLRESDYLVRWGGEEFLAIARDTDGLRVEELAERMRHAVAQRPFTLSDGHLLPVTCSIGFACMAMAQEQTDPDHWPAVVEMADRGLYAAKRAGRDAWVGVHRQPEDSSCATTALVDGCWASSSRPLDAVAQAYASASTRQPQPAHPTLA